MRSLVLFLCVCVLFVSGCDKDSDGSSNTSLITKDSWKLSTVTIGGVNVLPQVPDCYEDNVLDFFSDGSGTIDEWGNVCAPPAAAIFSWSFQSDETKLNMTTSIIPGGSGNFSIDALSETTMVLSQETSLIPSPTQQIVVMTFVHP